MPLSLAGATLGGAALSALGGLFSNRSQTRAAQAQMDFQAEMSSTAYQRAMKDMRKAGLNPMLAYQKGGASTPSGAQPNIKNPLEGANTAASNYIAAKSAKAQIQNVEANTALTLEKANTEKLTQQNIAATTANTSASTVYTNQQTQTEIARTQKTWDEITRILVDNQIRMDEGALLSQMAKIDQGIRSGKISETLRWIKLNLGIDGKDALDLIKYVTKLRKDGAAAAGPVPRTQPTPNVNVIE